MRTLSRHFAPFITALLIVAGGLGASAAQASETGAGQCVPTATVQKSAGKITAKGSAQCLIEKGNPVTVTVVLYVQGWNEGSSAHSCKADAWGTCYGSPVSGYYTSNDYCARTIVTYKTSGVWKQSATTTGC